MDVTAGAHDAETAKLAEVAFDAVPNKLPVNCPTNDPVKEPVLI
jgi:hypothetical protein